jgi:hypothetical protein
MFLTIFGKNNWKIYVFQTGVCFPHLHILVLNLMSHIPVFHGLSEYSQYNDQVTKQRMTFILFFHYKNKIAQK